MPSLENRNIYQCHFFRFVSLACLSPVSWHKLSQAQRRAAVQTHKIVLLPIWELKVVMTPAGSLGTQQIPASPFQSSPILAGKNGGWLNNCKLKFFIASSQKITGKRLRALKRSFTPSPGEKQTNKQTPEFGLLPSHIMDDYFTSYWKFIVLLWTQCYSVSSCLHFL